MSCKHTFESAFASEIARIKQEFTHAPLVRASSWQSKAAPDDMIEVFGHSFHLALAGTDLALYQRAIGPRLPWANEHFEKERVSGDPVNPGETYKHWVSGASASTFLNKHNRFDHTYAERYWPRFAGLTSDGRLPETPENKYGLQGIRYRYGDLDDLITVLVEDPLTRQAYLPVWFPEDLAAAVNKARVPCSLGYHFMRRGDKLHITYYIRSCDFVRHFRDDVYLTIRLLLWVLEQCKLSDPPGWYEVMPGTLTMHISSLHMFHRDYSVIMGAEYAAS